VYEQIAKNKRRTFLLLFFFVALIAAAALAFNFLLGFGAIGVVVAIVFAIVMAWGSYFYSDRVALAASRAKPAEGPEYQRYHNLVEGLCIAAGLPKPRLYVVDDPAPNAFATGRNPKHAALAVTTGLLETMNRVELEGVIAHELSHVKNYDILVTTVAVTAVGAIALLSDLGLRFMWFGGGDRRDRADSGVRGEPAAGVARRCERRSAHSLPSRADRGAREAQERPGRRPPRHPGHRPDVDRVTARTRQGRR
jgi:heat shock protein HtpX